MIASYKTWRPILGKLQTVANRKQQNEVRGNYSFLFLGTRKQLAIQEETLSKQENRFTLERQAMENDAMNRLSRLKVPHML